MSQALQDMLNTMKDVNPRDTKLFGYCDQCCILFADGEVCSTKAGELFGARTLHMLQPPKRDEPFNEVEWPHKFGQIQHKCVFIHCETYAEEQAYLEKARELIPIPCTIG